MKSLQHCDCLGLLFLVSWSQCRDVPHSTDLPLVEPGINAKTCQLNFSKSLPFCLTGSRQNAARTVSNLVSGRAGEKTLLSDEFIIVSLHPSATLGADDFNGTFLRPQTGPRPLEAFPVDPNVPGWGSWQDAVPAALSFFIFATHSRRHWQFVIGKQELWALRVPWNRVYFFLSYFCKPPQAHWWVGCAFAPCWVCSGLESMGCAHLGSLQRFSFPCWDLVLLTPSTTGGEQREPALPLGEIPSILQDGEFAVFVWWTRLFTMGHCNPSWLTTFFFSQVCFFCGAAPCAQLTLSAESGQRLLKSWTFFFFTFECQG